MMRKKITMLLFLAAIPAILLSCGTSAQMKKWDEVGKDHVTISEEGVIG